MFPGQPPFPLDAGPPPRRPRRPRISMGDDPDSDPDDPTLPAMVGANDALLLSWEERQRRARTVRLLVMFLTMLLLMDGDPDQRRRSHDRAHHGRHHSTGRTRKYVPRPGEVTATGVGPAGTGGGGGGEGGDPEYEALRSSLVPPSSSTPTSTGKTSEAEAEAEAEERYRRVIESHPRYAELARRDAGLPRGDGATAVAEEVTGMRRHHYYPRNATGYYRGVWTRVALGPTPGTKVPADGAKATAGKVRRRLDDDDDAGVAGPGVGADDDDDGIRPAGGGGAADAKSNANAFDLDADAAAAAAVAEEEDEAEQDRLFDLIRTAMLGKNDTVGVFLLPPGIASDPIPPPPLDDTASPAAKDDGVEKKKGEDGKGGHDKIASAGRKKAAATTGDAYGDVGDDATATHAVLSREADAAGAFVPRWKNLTAEAERAEAAKAAEKEDAAGTKKGGAAAKSSATTTSSAGSNAAAATTFPLRAPRGKLAIQLVLRPMVPPSPPSEEADADGEEGDAAAGGSTATGGGGVGVEDSAPGSRGGAGAGAKREGRRRQKGPVQPRQRPELSLVEGYVKLFDNDGGILITTAAAAGAGAGGTSSPGGRPPQALHSGGRGGAGANGGLPPGGAGGSSSSSAFVLRARGIMVNALGRISMVANADPGRGVVLLSGGADGGGGRGNRGGGGGGGGRGEGDGDVTSRREEVMDHVDYGDHEEEAEAVGVGVLPPPPPSPSFRGGSGGGLGGEDRRPPPPRRGTENATSSAGAPAPAPAPAHSESELPDGDDGEAESEAESEAEAEAEAEAETATEDENGGGGGEMETDPDGGGGGTVVDERPASDAAGASPDDAAESVVGGGGVDDGSSEGSEDGGDVGGAEEGVPSRRRRRRRMALNPDDYDGGGADKDDNGHDHHHRHPLDLPDDHDLRRRRDHPARWVGWDRLLLLRSRVADGLGGLVDPHGIWTELYPRHDDDDDEDAPREFGGLGLGLGLVLGGTGVPSGEHLYLLPGDDHDVFDDEEGEGGDEDAGAAWDGGGEVEVRDADHDGPPLASPAPSRRRLGASDVRPASAATAEAELSRSDVLALPVITQSSAYTSPISQAPRAGAGSKCEFEINLDVDPMLFTPPPIEVIDTEEGTIHVRGTTKKTKGERTITDVWDVPTDPEPSPEEREQLVVKMTGSIVSRNCNFAATITSTALRIDWTRITTRAINYSFAMMLICLGQIVLLLRQLLHSQTNSVASRVSMAGVGWQCLLDAIWCVVHILLCLVIRPLFMAFASVAFFKLLMFCVIEMKYMQIIYHARQASQGITMNPEAVRREAASLQMKFYIALVAVMILYWNMRDHWRLLVVMLHGFWLPQIVLNAITEARRPLHPYYLTGMSVTRLVAPIYVFGVRGNFIRDMNPDFPRDVMLCWTLVFWVGLQACVLVMQGRYGARFMIPARCLPPKFDYSRPIPSSLLPDPPSRSQENGGVDNDVEIGGTSSSSSTSNASTTGSRNRLTGNRQRTSSSGAMTSTTNGNVGGGAHSHALDCVICYGDIDVHDRRGYMLAPCDHIFHRRCLEQWMEVKMECPICRTDLPPI